VVIDLGTGDGRAVLARARSSPPDLILGIDATAAAMREVSQRAAAKPARGGVGNARFFVEAAEALPGPLAGTAHIVTITLPWGSLLRGVLGREPRVMAGIAGLVRPGGVVEALISVTPRDGIGGLDALTDAAGPVIAAAWAEHGVALTAMRPAAPVEVLATASTWARRLGDRPIWRLAFGVARTAPDRARNRGIDHEQGAPEPRSGRTDRRDRPLTMRNVRDTVGTSPKDR